MQLRKELNQSHTHTHTGITAWTGAMAAKRSWNLSLWNEKYITSRQLLLKRQAARHGPELKRSWDLIRCGSLSLARETSSRSRSSCSLPLMSSKCEVVALQSVYCPLAFIRQDSFGTGRSIWKKRWRKKHRPLTDPNLANGMQSVSLKNCRFFFPSEPHRIC